MFVGRGAARIRDLFKVARKYSPSIIFIDELDAVGGRRGKSFNDERDQTLNQVILNMGKCYDIISICFKFLSCL